MPYRPKSDTEKDEFIIPPIQGTNFMNWGGLSRFDQFSRGIIDDTQADDLQNFLPMGPLMRQVPAPTQIGTLPAGTVVWMSAQELNAGLIIFVLSSSGGLYTMTTGGVFTLISGATTLSTNTQIANWQGTTILFTDPNASKIYSWNGTTFATVFASQQASFMAVFQGHLWLAQGSTITWSDTNSFSSLGGVGGSLVITDSDCTTPINGLFAFGGLLYVFGPNFIQVISNLSVSGQPSVLQFTKYTLTSQIGINTIWSVVPYGSTLYFTNNYGIYSCTGSVPVKISQPLDGFFQQFNSNSSFSGGYAVIWNNPCLMWNMHMNASNPADTTYRLFGVTTVNSSNILGATQNMTWFSTVFGTNTFVTSYVFNGVPTIWSTDGTNVSQQFNNNATTVTSKFNSKEWQFGSPIGYDNIDYFALFCVTNSAATCTVQYNDDNGNAIPANPLSPTNSGPITQSVSNSITWINNFNNPVTWQNNSLSTITWVSNSVLSEPIFQYDGPGRFRTFNANVTFTGTGMMFQSISVGYHHSQAGWGA